MSGINLPEVHIPLPASAVYVVERVAEVVTASYSFLQEAVQWFKITPELYEHLKTNVWLIFGISIIFWPLVLSLVMTFTSAGTFVFWLLTSLVFGLLQLVYVVYQFLMIAVDICGLSVLKTYAVVRSRFLYYLGKSGSWDSARSRRLVWRERLEAAETYEEFLKIQIEPHEPSQHTKRQSRRSDPAIMIKSSSFSDMEQLSPTRQASMTRNKSFSTITASLSDAADEGDGPEPLDPTVVEELGEMATVMLLTTKQRLKEARQTAIKHEDDTEASSTLKHLLTGVVKRNHLNVDNFCIQNARAVANAGQYGLSAESRKLINAHYDEVEKALDWIADAPIVEKPESITNFSSTILEGDESSDRSHNMRFDRMRFGASELSDRMTLIRKMKQNMGRTALMLSGGGAQAMYHLGTIRALIESNLYDDIKVISGTSGGSISAAMCAIKTAEELHRDVCVPTVSTDYGLTGEQARENIRWFPPVTDMAKYWVKTKLLVDSALFRRTCEFYYKDITFEEAFERTGKHVCITVSASRASGGDSAQRLLLNHISTPHVTLASAVAASCALPGVMAPAKLLAKNSAGVLEPFEVDGVEWIDGSVQADLPFERIATLFNVSNFIVGQTNFHVMPFLNKAHHPDRESLYWRLFQLLEWDIRNRALQLSRLGLFPKMFGQDMSKVFKQKYHGNLTIVPRFTPAQTLGLKVLSNPTVKDMDGYLKYGQIAAWPYLNVIRNMLRLEKALDASLSRLEERYRDLHPEIDWAAHDEIDSIASGSHAASTTTPNTGSRVRFGGIGIVGQERNAEKMRSKMMTLEQENQKLKQQLLQMEKLLALNGKSKDGDKENRLDGQVTLTEGDVWNLVLRGDRPTPNS